VGLIISFGMQGFETPATKLLIKLFLNLLELFEIF